MAKFSTSHSLLIWPTLPPSVYFSDKSDWLPFPLNQPNCRVFSLARHAIVKAFQELNFRSDDVVLVPAYHHGSEIEALLEAGVQISYYEVNENLEPDPLELQNLMTSKVRALYIIHYLGFPQNVAFWRQWCDEHGIILIEDAAQAFLATFEGRPVGSFGHMGIFCLYKTYGLPDGGVVISDHPPLATTKASQSGIWRAFKRHINWIATRRKEIGMIHLLFKPVQTRLIRIINVLHKRFHAEFEVGDPSTPPSKMTMKLLPRLLSEKTAERRRENYTFLLSHLGDMVPNAFKSLPEGASPFAFPIEINQPREFLNRLRRRGVMGLLFWINPHPSLPVDDFPTSKKLREGVLALPVHQELTPTNLQQIVEAVLEARVGLNEKVAVAD